MIANMNREWLDDTLGDSGGRIDSWWIDHILLPAVGDADRKSIPGPQFAPLYRNGAIGLLLGLGLMQLRVCRSSRATEGSGSPEAGDQST
jgi:hypothetical protein